MSAEFKRILVALREGSSYDLENPVVARAGWLARKLGAQLHFFQSVPEDVSLASMVGGATLREIERRQDLEAEEERVAELAAEVAREYSVTTTSFVAHSEPRAGAIIFEAGAWQADLIMKEARDDRYVLGLFSNTDWDLLRGADMPVWLVQPGSDMRQGILAAIEVHATEQSELQLDAEVFQVARTLHEQTDAPLHAVHAYEVPASTAFAGYVPMYPGEVLPAQVQASLEEELLKRREQVARAHGQSISDFLQQFSIKPQDIALVEGPPAAVIKSEAERHQAGLIVMGASRGKGRWQRLFGGVTAEAALDEAPCDILFVHSV